MDPRIRIRIHPKMSWIRNTGVGNGQSTCAPMIPVPGVVWSLLWGEAHLAAQTGGDILPGSLLAEPVFLRSPGIASASQCCGSGMFIPDPDFYPSRIQKQQWKTGVKKICCQTFFWSYKFYKIELFYFWNVEEKNLGLFSKNYRTFYPNGVWYPEKTYSGSRSRGQKGTGSRFRTAWGNLSTQPLGPG